MTRNWRKLCSLLLAAAMVGTILSGCGSEKEQGADTAEPSQTAGAQQEKDTAGDTGDSASAASLSFWGWIPYNNVIEPMTAAFQEENADIDVDVQIMDWGAYWDKLTLDLANGEGPDVFAMNLDNYEKYKDYMEPLDGLAAQVIGDDWKTLFNEKMLESTYVDEDLKIFPVDFGGQWYVFYNKTLLGELGQSVPNGYQAFADYAKAVENDTIPMIFGGKESLNVAYLYLWLVNNQNPGIVSKAAAGEASFEDEAFLKGFEDLQKMMDDGVIPKNSFGIDPTTDADSLFKERKSPMILTGAWQAGAYLAGTQLADSKIAKDEIGVFAMPTPINDNPYVVGSIDHGWAINKNSKNKEAAMKLVAEWAAGDAAQIWLEELYGIPCAAGVTLDTANLPSQEAKDTIGVISDTLSDQLAGPRSTGNAAVDNKTGEVVQAFVQGMMDAKDATAQMQQAYESSK